MLEVYLFLKGKVVGAWDQGIRSFQLIFYFQSMHGDNQSKNNEYHVYEHPVSNNISFNTEVWSFVCTTVPALFSLSSVR